MKRVELPDENATAALAGRLAERARRGDAIALYGELGVGKTSFARAFIRARGRGDEEVPSPTFTLVQIYDLPGGPVWHFDLYRLASPEDAYELGIEEAFAQGISLIEWPERLGPLLPASRIALEFAFGDRPEARVAVLRAGAQSAARLCEICAGE